MNIEDETLRMFAEAIRKEVEREHPLDDPDDPAVVNRVEIARGFARERLVYDLVAAVRPKPRKIDTV